jgi:hypothetical protein
MLPSKKGAADSPPPLALTSPQRPCTTITSGSPPPRPAGAAGREEGSRYFPFPACGDARGDPACTSALSMLIWWPSTPRILCPFSLTAHDSLHLRRNKSAPNTRAKSHLFTTIRPATPAALRSAPVAPTSPARHRKHNGRADASKPPGPVWAFYYCGSSRLLRRASHVANLLAARALLGCLFRRIASRQRGKELWAADEAVRAAAAAAVDCLIQGGG